MADRRQSPTEGRERVRKTPQGVGGSTRKSTQGGKRNLDRRQPAESAGGNVNRHKTTGSSQTAGRSEGQTNRGRQSATRQPGRTQAKNAGAVHTGTRSRQSSKSKKAKRKRQLRLKVISWIMTAFFVVVFYALICAFVGDDKLYKGTIINGIDVGGKSAAAAAELVSESLESNYSKARVAVNLEDTDYILGIGSALGFDVKSKVEDIQKSTHRFWRRGYGYLASKFVEDEYRIYPTVKDKSVIERVIEGSGLMNVNLCREEGYKIEGDKLILTKGEGSYAVDIDKLTSGIVKQVEKGNYRTSIECPVVSADVNIEDVYEKVHTEPQNPTLDEENGYKVVEAQDGIDFDVASAKTMLASASDGEAVEIPLIHTEAEMSTQEYEALLFRDRMSSYSSIVEGSENRRTNVSLAAKSCDGAILLPGESFSYNGAVGQTTEEKGYMPAPAYANGESILEYGGGICQVSSTLYMACLYANLEINERHSHPYPASYVPTGLDATVAWGSCDYVFSNNTDYPIKISVVYDGSQVVCTITGTLTDSFNVELYTEVKATEEYETKYELDEALGEDDRELETTGITGITIQSYRRVYGADGSVIYDSPEALSVYSKRDEVYRVGRLPDEDGEDKDKSSEDDTEEKTTEEKTTEENTTEEKTTEEKTTEEKTTEEKTTEEVTTEEKTTEEKTTEETISETTTEELTTEEVTTEEVTTEEATTPDEEPESPEEIVSEAVSPEE